MESTAFRKSDVKEAELRFWLNISVFLFKSGSAFILKCIYECISILYLCAYV